MTYCFRCEVCDTVCSAGDDMVGSVVSCPACSARLESPRHGSGCRPREDGTVAADAPLPTAEVAPIDFGGTEGRVIDDEMDMTPMVDVTFLLLIFFMVTASFSLQKSFEAPAPNQDEPSTQARTVDDFEDDPEYVVVRVDMYNTYHVLTAKWDQEREAPSKQELLVALNEARLPGKGGVVPNRMLVVANGEALHERVVTAQDAGTEVGMDDVKLVTVEEDD